MRINLRSRVSFIAMLAVVLAGVLTMTSCEEQKIKFRNLPSAARAFILTYFPGVQCSYAEKERDDGRTEYSVVLDNGTEIDFDSSGTWTSVDCKFSLIPDGVLPVAIVDDVAARYPGAGIYKVERQLGGYEVSIGSGLELIYSAGGQFVREDRY